MLKTHGREVFLFNVDTRRQKTLPRKESKCFYTDSPSKISAYIYFNLNEALIKSSTAHKKTIFYEMGTSPALF